jgi:hypothetical protein
MWLKREGQQMGRDLRKRGSEKGRVGRKNKEIHRKQGQKVHTYF